MDFEVKDSLKITLASGRLLLRQIRRPQRADETAEIETIVAFAQEEARRLRYQARMLLRDLNGFRSVDPTLTVNHLDNVQGIRRYQRKAAMVARFLPAGRLLDWGSYYGQMTFLLAHRGLDVVAFDIQDNALPATLNALIGRPTVYSSDLVRLPFEDGSFDGVLSCGTLEHVADPARSVREIHRILRQGGRLFIFNLPNAFSWVEFFGRFCGSAHERRYILKSAVNWLRSEGFNVLLNGYENVAPATVSSLRVPARRFLLPVVEVVSRLDPVLERVPPFRWLATNLTIVCERR